MVVEIGSYYLTNLLLPANGMNNTALLHLNLFWNDIEGAEGGQQVGMLLQHCPNLKELDLSSNNLGPLGARAMAPGLAAASNLESLNLAWCCIGNNGMMELVNMSLTSLNLRENDVQGLVGGENVVALAARCTNLVRLDVEIGILNPDQKRRLNLLLDPEQKQRLCIEAQALAGSTFPVLFRFMEERAHGHRHGISAIFVILQNDGDDYFCNANNRANP
jgi:Leucine Rich repeat